MPEDSGGPFLTAALICERVLQEQDGVPSAIRIIDRVFFGTDEEGTLLQPHHPITLFVSFKAGAARGSYPIAVHVEKPSAETDSLLEASMFFEGEERGANLILSAMFAPEMPGLYWFDVYFDGDRVTRIPLRAIYQRQPTAGPPG